VLRTADAVSPVSAAQVLVSLLLFVLVYVVVFSIGVWYIHRMIDKGPHTALPGPETLANRPLAGGQPDRKEAVPA
jgi:cytochrome d ubiquinol oxidase subunit I